MNSNKYLFSFIECAKGRRIYVLCFIHLFGMWVFFLFSFCFHSFSLLLFGFLVLLGHHGQYSYEQTQYTPNVCYVCLCLVCNYERSKRINGEVTTAMAGKGNVYNIQMDQHIHRIFVAHIVVI